MSTLFCTAVLSTVLGCLACLGPEAEPQPRGFGLPGAGWFWYLHAIPSTPTIAAIDGLTIRVFGPSLGGVVLGALTVVTVASLNVTSLRQDGVRHVWKKHCWAICLAIAAGPLWYFSVLPDILWNTQFLLFVFFLPLMCFSYAWPMTDSAWYILLLLGAPAQYLAMGIFADAVRRTTRPARKAAALLWGSGCVLALLVYFLVWANRYPDYPGSRFPGRGERAAIAGVQGVAVCAVALMALRLWRRRSRPSRNGTLGAGTRT